MGRKQNERSFYFAGFDALGVVLRRLYLEAIA